MLFFLKVRSRHESLNLLLSLLCLLTSTLIYADEAPPAIGNFVLPYSQQPGPLLSMGENSLAKGQTIAYMGALDVAASNSRSAGLVPQLVYGASDTLSVLFAAPYALNYQMTGHHSSGIADAAVQLEYAFFNASNKHYTDQATVLLNVSVPTGSTQKNPPIGNGSPGFLFGATYNRTWVEWFVLASAGTQVYTPNDNSKAGSQYLYQGGIGRNVFDIGKDWIIAALVEGDGTYSTKDRLNGLTNQNSGGNIIYVTPSLWVSSKKLILQLGVGFPVIQHWNGTQDNNTYLVAANFGWNFS